MFKVSPLRKRQFIGGLVGLVAGVLLIFGLSLEASEQYISLGPANTGHQDLNCIACHNDAKGNLFQQVQSNFSHAVGARKNDVDFGSKDVTVDNCLQCHDRPNDRHPTHRFSEPRFKDAIKNINATTCITCHKEHNEERVSLAAVAMTYCMNCHQTLEIDDDPVDISHKQLIEEEKWSTCIQCHDFHGNHKYEVAEKLSDTIPLNKIEAYLRGGEDPFGNDKKYLAMSIEDWLAKYNK